MQNILMQWRGTVVKDRNIDDETTRPNPTRPRPDPDKMPEMIFILVLSKKKEFLFKRKEKYINITGCIIRLFCSMLWWEKNSLFFFGPNWLDRQSIMLKPAVFNTIYSSLAAGPWVHVKVVQKTRQMAVQTTFGIGRGDDVGHTHSGLLSSAKDVLHKWQFHYLVDPPIF